MRRIEVSFTWRWTQNLVHELILIELRNCSLSDQFSGLKRFMRAMLGLFGFNELGPITPRYEGGEKKADKAVEDRRYLRSNDGATLGLPK